MDSLLDVHNLKDTASWASISALEYEYLFSLGTDAVLSRQISTQKRRGNFGKQHKTNKGNRSIDQQTYTSDRWTTRVLSVEGSRV